MHTQNASGLFQTPLLVTQATFNYSLLQCTMHTKTRSRTAEGAESSSDTAVRGTLTCNREVREDSGMNLRKISNEHKLHHSLCKTWIFFFKNAKYRVTKSSRNLKLLSKLTSQTDYSIYFLNIFCIRLHSSYCRFKRQKHYLSCVFISTVYYPVNQYSSLTKPNTQLHCKQ